MPEPVRSGQRYVPGLDGLRAIAVLVVIAYHEQFGWAPGGLLGVGVFFTLSGYLITDLLLGQWAADGRLGLGGFWLRRARRLLPALCVLLAVVSAWVTLFDRSQLASLRGAVPAAAGYVSNWYLIAAHSSYFSRFAPPAPLDHLWSLAVEEQFYLLWPWLLVAGLACLPRGRARAAGPPGKPAPTRVPWLALPVLGLAAASAAAMAAFYQPGFDPTRVYEGTDTRAAGLLIGAALALVWPSRRRAAASGRAAPAGRPATSLLVDGAGLAGLGVIGLMVWRVGQYSPFAYRGGIAVLSVATAAAVAAAVDPGSLTGTVLGWRPLRWVGVRSYGIYLWHYPVIVLTSPPSGAEDLPRAALQTAASITLAALSWRFVEEPVRRGALARLWRQARERRWSPARAGWARSARNAAGWAALAGGSGVLMVACAGLTGAIPARSPSTTATLMQPTGPAPAQPGGGAPLGQPAGPGVARAGPGDSGGPALAPLWARPARAGTPIAPPVAAAGAGGAPAAGLPGSGPGGLHTSCREVFHLGDSTSEGLVSPDYLPDPRRRITDRYEQTGVNRVYTFIEGATSVVETLPGTVNAYDAARRMVRHGYRGCWVIALGTNDTADVAVGSAVGRMARIERMMSLARGEPVLWVDVTSLRASGPYAETYMRQWNDTLRQACSRYPNLRIFDWASVARSRWFIPDGIHYTPAGYSARARMIAAALARAFPATGQSPGCVVK
jgi:peptidoglycan/LPS O-acetylase OafA/YrhL